MFGSGTCCGNGNCFPSTERGCYGCEGTSVNDWHPDVTWPDGCALGLCDIGSCCQTNPATGTVTCIENVPASSCQGENDVYHEQSLCTNQCDGDGGGGGGNGGDDDEPDTPEFCPSPVLGAVNGCQNSQITFRHVATRWRPEPELVETPLKEECALGKHDAIDSCVRRHYQASKNAFRIVSFVTMSDSDPQNGGACPGNWSGGGSWYSSGSACCCPECSPFYNKSPYAINVCTGETSGVTTRTIHERKQEFTITVYPFRTRCSQIKDINGFQRCGLLTQELEITNGLVSRNLPKLLVGAVDPLSCNQGVRTTNGSVETDFFRCQFFDICPTVDPRDNCNQTCIYGGEDTVPTYKFDGTDTTNDYDVWPVRNPDKLNAAGYCQDLRKDELFIAHSLILPQFNGAGIYTPNVSEAVVGIPSWSCPKSVLTSQKELDLPGKIPEDTILRTCAEYYNDKEISKLNNSIGLPPATDGVVFGDFGGIIEDESLVTGISAEYVDILPTDVGWSTFWMKQQYPGLQYLRLFSVGNFNIEGGFGGGITDETSDYGEGITRGLFAGSMVAIFDTEQNLKNFDGQIGNENIKFTVSGDGITGQGAGGGQGMENCEFIGRPMFNPFYVEENPSDDVGWIYGRGLTYANLQSGTGPWLGKAYQFCSKEVSTNLGECSLKPVAGTVDDDWYNSWQPGNRGPLGIRNRDPFSISIERIGITNEEFAGCEEDDGI